MSCACNCNGGSIGTRDCITQRPDMLPFQNRDFQQTTSVPVPLNYSWYQQVGLEDDLRRFVNRDVTGACDSTRSFSVPLSWSMTPLVHGWQQPDDFARYQCSSRMQVKDICRPAFCDSLEGRNYETRPCPNSYFDCTAVRSGMNYCRSSN